MLSYQHDYHAGNHADVLKHVLLVMLIQALQRKPTSLRVIDTHAGSGVYDLTGPMAQHGREYLSGVARLLEAREPMPAGEAYLELVASANPEGELRRYPGSAEIARRLLRPQDHLELFELHPQAVAALKERYGRDVQVHVHRRDGFEGLPAVVPPPERRGVVLIDPAYENKSEFRRVGEVVAAALRRWPGGVYALWYPVTRHAGASRLLDDVRALALPRCFRVQLELADAGAEGLRGSGLVIVNLPFGLDAELARLVPWLHRRLAPSAAGGWWAGWLSHQAG